MVEMSFVALFFAIPITAPDLIAVLDEHYLLTFEKRAAVATTAPAIWWLEFTVAPGLEIFACMDGPGLPLKNFPEELLQALRSPGRKRRAAAEKYLAHLACFTRSAAWHRERDEGEDLFRIALGKHAQPIHAALDLNLKDRPDGDALLAAVAMLALDQKHSRSLDIVVKAMAEKSADRREEVYKTIGGARLSHPRLIEALSMAIADQEKSVRLAAAGAVREIGPKARKAVPALIELLKTGEEACGDVSPPFAMAFPQRKNLALLALGQIGAEAKSAVSTIVSMFPSKDEETRLAMLVCLSEIGPAAREAIPELNRQLAAASGKPLYYAAAALLRIDPAHEKAEGALLAGLKSSNGKTRSQAFEACRAVAPKVKSLVPELAAGLKSSDDKIQADALLALIEIGPIAETAIPALVEMLNSGDKVPPQYHRAAAEALGSIGKAGYPALLKVALKVNFAAVSKLTEQMMTDVKAGKVGRDAKLPEKFDLIMNAAQVQPFAILAFGRLGKDGENVVPLLIDALAADHLAFHAAIALGRLKGVAAPAREELAKAARHHKIFEVRVSAAWALTQLDR